MIAATRGIGAEDGGDFIADPAELLHDLFLRTGSVCGIVEGPVMPVHLPGERGTGLIRVVANGDDSLDAAVEELVHVLRGMRGNIDSDFGHGRHGFGMNVSDRPGSRAMHIEQIPGRIPQDAFRHVAAAGIARAKNQDARFAHAVKAR